MKKSRFTDQQIAFALKQADSELAVEEVRRTLLFFRSTYGLAPE